MPDIKMGFEITRADGSPFITVEGVTLHGVPPEMKAHLDAKWAEGQTHTRGVDRNKNHAHPETFRIAATRTVDGVAQTSPPEAGLTDKGMLDVAKKFAHDLVDFAEKAQRASKP